MLEGAAYAEGDVADELHRRRRWPGRSQTCAPSSSAVRRSLGLSPTNCLRFGFFMEARCSERMPTKSVLALPMAQDNPASSGVTVPSVSCNRQ